MAFVVSIAHTLFFPYPNRLVRTPDMLFRGVYVSHWQK
jgi:hypothetical protein